MIVVKNQRGMHSIPYLAFLFESPGRGCPAYWFLGIVGFLCYGGATDCTLH